MNIFTQYCNDTNYIKELCNGNNRLRNCTIKNKFYYVGKYSLFTSYYYKITVAVYFTLEINENGQDWTSNIFISALHILHQVNNCKVPDLIHSISTNTENKVSKNSVNAMTNIQQKTEAELRPKVLDLLNTPQAMDNVQHNCGVKNQPL